MDVRSAAAAAAERVIISEGSNGNPLDRRVHGQFLVSINSFDLILKMRRFFVLISAVSSPKWAPKRPKGVLNVREVNFRKIMICASNYVFWPGKLEFNVGTMIGRTIFNKGPFYEPEGPILKYKTSYIDMGIKV